MKSFLILILSVIAVSLFGTSLAHAQPTGCSNGGTLKTVTMTIGNCDYEVKVCVNCQDGVPEPGEQGLEIISVSRSTNCSTTLNLSQILGAIKTQLRIPTFYSLYLCPPILPKLPCEDVLQMYNDINWKDPHSVMAFKMQVQTFKTVGAFCWKAVWYDLAGGGSKIVFHPCEDEARCTELYAFCIDPVTGEESTVRLRGPWQEGTPGCTTEEWEITDWPTNWTEESSCFLVHTPCNP
jgi:hypothetical protein